MPIDLNYNYICAVNNFSAHPDKGTVWREVTWSRTGVRQTGMYSDRMKRSRVIRCSVMEMDKKLVIIGKPVYQKPEPARIIFKKTITGA